MGTLQGLKVVTTIDFPTDKMSHSSLSRPLTMIIGKGSHSQKHLLLSIPVLENLDSRGEIGFSFARSAYFDPAPSAAFFVADFASSLATLTFARTASKDSVNFTTFSEPEFVARI